MTPLVVPVPEFFRSEQAAVYCGYVDATGQPQLKAWANAVARYRVPFRRRGRLKFFRRADLDAAFAPERFVVVRRVSA